MGFSEKDLEQLRANVALKPTTDPQGLESCYGEENTNKVSPQGLKREPRTYKEKLQQTKTEYLQSASKTDRSKYIGSANAQREGFIADLMERVFPGIAFHCDDNVVTFERYKKKVTVIVEDLK